MDYFPLLQDTKKILFIKCKTLQLLKTYCRFGNCQKIRQYLGKRIIPEFNEFCLNAAIFGLS